MATKKQKQLSLKANPNTDGRFPNIEMLSLRPPVRRYIGWQMVSVIVDGEPRVGFERKSEPDVVNFHNDYVMAVKHGDLVPCNKETADLCGVSFAKRVCSEQPQPVVSLDKVSNK